VSAAAGQVVADRSVGAELEEPLLAVEASVIVDANIRAAAPVVGQALVDVGAADAAVGVGAAIILRVTTASVVFGAARALDRVRWGGVWSRDVTRGRV